MYRKCFRTFRSRPLQRDSQAVNISLPVCYAINALNTNNIVNAYTCASQCRRTLIPTPCFHSLKSTVLCVHCRKHIQSLLKLHSNAL